VESPHRSLRDHLPPLGEVQTVLDHTSLIGGSLIGNGTALAAGGRLTVGIPLLGLFARLGQDHPALHRPLGWSLGDPTAEVFRGHASDLLERLHQVAQQLRLEFFRTSGSIAAIEEVRSVEAVIAAFVDGKVINCVTAAPDAA